MFTSSRGTPISPSKMSLWQNYPAFMEPQAAAWDRTGWKACATGYF
jgi:hypothetical protein